jgi:putative peptidoglycan lipid II flippase
VIRATGGVWISYATTALFQVLFASRFGSTDAATVFVIVFGITIAIGSVLTGCAQTVVVPRLMSADGVFTRSGITTLAVINLLAALFFGALVAWRSPLCHALAPHVHVSAASLKAAALPASVFVFFQVLSGTAIAAAIGRGNRLAPAAAPALPSIAGCLYLLVREQPTVTGLFVGLAAGATLEAIGLLALLRRNVRIESTALPRIGAITAATAVQFALLNLIPPVERIVASADSAAGAAQYNYAIRSLAVVLQLLIGGVILAALGDWSSHFRDARREVVTSSIVRTSVVALLVLTLASSIALVFGRQLVEVAYQRGAFTETDTHMVTTLLWLGLVGFCAEGLGLVLSQAIVAARKNKHAIGIGLVHFAVRLALVVALGSLFGVRGVVVGYSGAMVIVLAVQIVVVARITDIRFARSLALWRGLAVALGTVGAALIVAGFALALPLRGIAVLAAFVLLTLTLRPTSLRVAI